MTVSGAAAGSATVTHSVAGGDYGAVGADSVTVTVAARGVIVDPQTLDVVAGATSTYSVVLATRPTASVTVTPASGDTNTATVSGALTFTVSDWAVAQNVTVSGAAAGSATVTHSVAGGDYGANNVAADSVTVTVAARGVIVAPTSLDIVVRVNPIAIDPDRGAILAASNRIKFAATAAPTENAPGQCRTVSAESAVDDRGTPNNVTDDTVFIELRVLAQIPARGDCDYDVTVYLPPGFTAATEAKTIKGVEPGSTVDINVGVATRRIFLLQAVVGDSAGAAAKYELSDACNEPASARSLPPPLKARPGGGGIVVVPPQHFVPLVEGYFNITNVLAADPTADAADGIMVHVLDSSGVACGATVSVSQLPDRCTAEQDSVSVDLLTAPSQTILEFRIQCVDDTDTATAVGTIERRGGVGVPLKIVSAEVAGTYTVTWVTQGGCDPGEGTSGTSGMVGMSVTSPEERDSDPAPGELMGAESSRIVSINPTCAYKWKATLIESTTGAICRVGPTPFAADSNNEINITLPDAATDCIQGSSIVVQVSPLAAEPDRGAILATKFVATAVPAEGVPAECTIVMAESDVDDQDTPDDLSDDTVLVNLTILEQTPAGQDCGYDVSLSLPVGFSRAPEVRTARGVEPGTTVDVRVGVATRTLFVVQNVVGDSGGAPARYELSTVCAAPGSADGSLPRLLPGVDAEVTHATRRVQLLAGRFNISAALAADPAAPGASAGIPVRVLDSEGSACLATVSVSDLPDRCTAQRDSEQVELLTAPARTIIEFTIRCDQ